jgi:hypothetical protein
MSGRLVVAKIGTSSLTDEPAPSCRRRSRSCAPRWRTCAGGGDRVVVVSSGAIAAGLPFLGLGEPRPTDPAVLQAVSAVGQVHLVGHYNRALAAHGLVGGRCSWRRLTSSTAGNISTPDRPSGCCSTSEWYPSSTKMTPSLTTRSASATTTAWPLWSRIARRRPARAADRHPGLAHGRPPGRPGGFAHRGDRGGRPPDGGHGRRGRNRPRGAGGWPRSWRRPRSRPGPGCGSVIAGAARPGVLADAAAGVPGWAP